MDEALSFRFLKGFFDEGPTPDNDLAKFEIGALLLNSFVNSGVPHLELQGFPEIVSIILKLLSRLID